MVEKLERMLNLVSFLLKRSDPVPWSDILGKVHGYDDDQVSPEALERRFQRDKRDLRKMGIPLDFLDGSGAGQEGYQISRDQFFLEDLELTAGERLILNLVSRLVADEVQADTAEPSRYQDELLSALRKIQFDNPEAFAELPKRTPYAPGLFEMRDTDYALANVEELFRAVLTRSQLDITYWTIDRDDVTRRKVDPYGLGFREGHWYLVGHCHLRKGTRVFRVDRMRGRLRKSRGKKAFEVPPGFRLTDHIGRPAWELEGSSEYLATVRVSADIAWAVGELTDEVETLEVGPDGAQLLRFQVRNEKGFLRWALKRLRHLEVVEPASLREALDREVEAALVRYQRPAPDLSQIDLPQPVYGQEQE